MLLSLQNVLNSGVMWLPWLSRIRSLLLLTVFCLICFSKWWIHSRPILSVVQPFLLIENVYVEGRPWKNHVWLNSFPFITMKGGIRVPSTHTPQINMTYSVLVGLTCFSLPSLSVAVTTLEAEICPIQKPVSSKLQMSSGRMPYLSTVFFTSVNQPLIASESLLSFL